MNLKQYDTEIEQMTHRIDKVSREVENLEAKRGDLSGSIILLAQQLNDKRVDHMVKTAEELAPSEEDQKLETMRQEESELYRSALLRQNALADMRKQLGDMKRSRAELLKTIYTPYFTEQLESAKAELIDAAAKLAICTAHSLCVPLGHTSTLHVVDRNIKNAASAGILGQVRDRMAVDMQKQAEESAA